MSVEQYLRKVSLTIGGDTGEGLDLSNLRIKFHVQRGDTQTPNTADIRVYNVSEETAQKVQKEFDRVILQAGYEGNFGVIFDGTIKQVRRGRESQVDTYLDITVADGDSAYNFSVLSLSLAAGQTAPNSAVQEYLKATVGYGVSKGYIPDLPGNSLPRGKAVYGMTRDEMRKLAHNTDTSWSIQDGKVNMVPLTAYMPGDVPILTAATGMVGLPEQTQNGIKIKVLLNPNIKIGQAVKIDNKSIQKMRYGLSLNSQQSQNYFNELAAKLNDDGFYYVMVAEHSGDTRGQDYYSNLICLAIDATVIPTGLLNRSTAPSADSVKRFG